MSEKPKNEVSKMPPSWAWIFIFACVAIPVVALGGALPAGLGAGGALGCYRAARNTERSTRTNVMYCIGITIGVWAFFLALTFFIFPMLLANL